MADFRYLRLSVQARSAGDESGLAAAQSLDIPRGHSVLVDLSALSWRKEQVGIPLGEKVAGEPRVVQAEKKPAERRFYLITPRTIVVSEQEVLGPPRNVERSR